MSNPFSLSFGKEPKSIISRDLICDEIIDNFNDKNPGYQVCMITGVRGSGKTVMLTSIAARLKQERDWIVINLSPDCNLIHMMAAELCNRNDLMELFRDAKINLSLFGLGLEIDGVPPITDEVIALRRMLEKLTRNGKKVLVAIDEVVPAKNIREFIGQFQIFMRENYNIFMLMTGLYENIYELQNEATLTFLYRAPKVELPPLSTGLIAKSYREIFGLDHDEAVEMAEFSKGYPYAYQLLGYLCWTKNASWRDVVEEYDTYLEDYVYDKIWSECSAQDKDVLRAISNAPTDKVENIRNVIGMSSNVFTVYRKRLIKKGLIRSTGHGRLELVLPRFDVFVNNNS